MRDTDLAWAAGFLDGEGCFDAHQIKDRRVGQERRARLMPRLICGQSTPEPLHRLAAMFGGQVRLRRDGNDKHRPTWAWELTGAKRVAPMLDALLPYLMVKRAEALILRELCDRYGPRGKRLTGAEIAARNDLALRLSAAKHTGRGATKHIDPASA